MHTLKKFRHLFLAAAFSLGIVFTTSTARAFVDSANNVNNVELSKLDFVVKFPKHLPFLQTKTTLVVDSFGGFQSAQFHFTNGADSVDMRVTDEQLKPVLFALKFKLDNGDTAVYSGWDSNVSVKHGHQHTVSALYWNDQGLTYSLASTSKSVAYRQLVAIANSIK